MGHDKIKGDGSPDGICTMVAALIVALLICWLLGSCKGKERVTEVVTVRDTVLVGLRSARTTGDSVTVREVVTVRPVEVKTGDTVLIRKDTTVVVERWRTRWVTASERRDSTAAKSNARVGTSSTTAPVVEARPKKGSSNARRTLTAMAAGLLLLTAAVWWRRRHN